MGSGWQPDTDSASDTRQLSANSSAVLPAGEPAMALTYAEQRELLSLLREHTRFCAPWPSRRWGPEGRRPAVDRRSQVGEAPSCNQFRSPRPDCGRRQPWRHPSHGATARLQLPRNVKAEYSYTDRAADLPFKYRELRQRGSADVDDRSAKTAIMLTTSAAFSAHTNAR